MGIGLRVNVIRLIRYGELHFAFVVSLVERARRDSIEKRLNYSGSLRGLSALVGRYVPSAKRAHGRLAGCFVKGIISLGEVERQIPLLMRLGRGNSLLIPCSADTNLHIWAEFGDFWMEFEKFPVNFAVLVIRMEMGEGFTNPGAL
jgi:hypothetical protein